MTEAQLARKIEEASRRYGPKLAVANVLRSLDDADILSLWRSVGPSVARAVWRRHRPNIEIVRSIQGALRQLVSIGTTGERKPLDQVTAVELRIIAQFRQRMGDTLTAQAKCIRRIADKIENRTVGEAWDEIGASDRKALLEAFGIASPDNIQLTA